MKFRSIAFVLPFCLLFSGCGSSQRGSRVDYASNRETSVLKNDKGEAGLLASCPVGMVLIPGGPMLYGPTEEKSTVLTVKDEAQRIQIRGFCIDKYEYPNEPGEAPMRSVSWVEASGICSNKGKRLCSEYEFEKACRGPSGTLFTYGDGYAAKTCPGAADEYGIGQYSNCVSGFGVFDMSGGVFEWTSSGAPGAEGQNTTEQRIVRGGMSADHADKTSRCTYRVRFGAGASSREVGFRCCAAVQKEEMNK